MAANGSGAPVIRKRRKVSGDAGYHGGAWKVAMTFLLQVARFAPAFRDAGPGRARGGMAGSF